MTAPFAARPYLPGHDDTAGIDALVTDRYLDALLAAAERGAPATPADAELDSALREATDILRRSLVRIHPSFRFEERLGARLADLAAEPDPARAGATVIAFRPRNAAGAAASVDPLLAAVIDGTLDPADADAVARAEGLRSRTRPLIVGGAITSAAISLVGVALVAWRASRTAHERRDGLLAATGAGGPA
jgi:hypothetical protein